MCPNVFAYCRISPSHSRGTSQQLQLEDLFTNWLELAILWHFFPSRTGSARIRFLFFFSPTLIICGTLGGQMFSVEYCNCYSGAVSLANSKLVGSKICSQTGRCSESEIANDHIVPVLLLSWTNLCHLRFPRKNVILKPLRAICLLIIFLFAIPWRASLKCGGIFLNLFLEFSERSLNLGKTVFSSIWSWCI